MSSSNSPGASLWCWRRRIDPEEEDTWLERLGRPAPGSWTVSGKPNAIRPVLSVYIAERARAAAWQRRWQGEIQRVRPVDWLDPSPSPPQRIGRSLEIVSDAPKKPRAGSALRLFISHGLAFGSGEHTTTSMLLHALARRRDLAQARVLDLGTGSGILALAARRLGAQRIVAIDFESVAIRTARENERRNFSRPIIDWRCADVRKISTTKKYDLVLANLFSGILCEASALLAGAVAPGGRLWLSGILRRQEKEVIAAYRKRELQLERAARRGKWVLLEWRRKEQRPTPSAPGPARAR